MQAQLVETALLNIVNFQTLIATKSARVCLAAQGEQVLEFGLRRAQGLGRRITAGHENGQRNQYQACRGPPTREAFHFDALRALEAHPCTHPSPFATGVLYGFAHSGREGGGGCSPRL